MKEKNTFAKLRAEKNNYKNKHEASLQIITSQVDRIDTLDRAIDIQDNQIKLLSHELKEYKAKRKRLLLKLRNTTLDKDIFYKEWMKENKNKVRITKKLAFSLGLNIGLIILLIIVCK